MSGYAQKLSYKEDVDSVGMSKFFDPLQQKASTNYVRPERNVIFQNLRDTAVKSECCGQLSVVEKKLLSAPSPTNIIEYAGLPKKEDIVNLMEAVSLDEDDQAVSCLTETSDREASLSRWEFGSSLGSGMRVAKPKKKKYMFGTGMVPLLKDNTESVLQSSVYVSILLLHKCEPPVLACAVNEAIASIAGENSSSMPTLIIPFLLPEARLKLDDKILLKNVIKALVNRTQKLPSSLQINDEALACSVQLARVMKIPTFLLVGLSGQSKSRKSYEEDLKVLCGIGEVLASLSSLSFVREKITWTPTKTSRDSVEPWHALYG